MHVLATAGHVDHGKSTLVRALTGSDPDRLAEEKRRGLTIELGYAWTEVDGEEIAFVDVPGHQRFLSTTLSGLGPVPAVLFVVAADEGWRRQSGEHLAALDSLGVDRGLLVVTRSDLADPGSAAEAAGAAMAGTSLAGLPWVGVSARTGEGLEAVRQALGRLVSSLPAPDPLGPVRLWIDRIFSVAGAGTVATATLGAGTVRVGDTLLLGDRELGVRSLESLGRARPAISGTARVALGLRGVSRDEVRRGDVLLSQPQRHTDLVDVTLRRPVEELPTTAVSHIGSSATPSWVRRLSPTHVRLRLESALPLVVGDRLILRDPSRQVVVAGVTVVDIDPPAFTRRGAARRRAEELGTLGERPDATREVGRRPFTTRAELTALGALPERAAPLPPSVLEVDGRLVTADHWSSLGTRLRALLEEAEAGALPREHVRRTLELPSGAVLEALVEGAAGVRSAPGGRLAAGDVVALSPRLVALAGSLTDRWRTNPLDVPDAEELRGLGLDEQAAAQLEAAGVLVRLAPGVVVGSSALPLVEAALRALPEPFSVSAVRQALGSSRRVVVPLLEFCDRRGWTRRHPDSTRILTRSGRMGGWPRNTCNV